VTIITISGECSSTSSSSTSGVAVELIEKFATLSHLIGSTRVYRCRTLLYSLSYICARVYLLVFPLANHHATCHFDSITCHYLGMDTYYRLWKTGFKGMQDRSIVGVEGTPSCTS
jgi:hypothetical protein